MLQPAASARFDSCAASAWPPRALVASKAWPSTIAEAANAASRLPPIALAGALGVTRVLQTFLFGVTPTDPIAFTIVTLLLIAVGLMAAWLPARRATRIDPWAALRAE